ncbi:MAG TPA: hypothetical protein VGM50_22770 [Gemmatimonadaceae bacterium]|jgi:spermidine synthase
MKPVELLGEALTPNGAHMALYRHDGSYLIRVNGIELMSTRRHLSEDRLAEVACAPLKDTPGARVLIGGLGLGFTLRAALALMGSDAQIAVAEIMAAVVEWNADSRYDLSAKAMADPRVQIVQDDVLSVLRRSAGSFDAIMLDTDNGADGLLMSENASLYSVRGVAATVAALKPGGTIVYWSVSDDPKFVRQLRGANLQVETLHARAHTTTGPMHTLYVVKEH